MKIGRLNRASFAKTARRAMFLFAFAVLGTQAAAGTVSVSYELNGETVSFSGATLREVNNQMRTYWEVNSDGCAYNAEKLPADGTGTLTWKVSGTVEQGAYLGGGALVLPSLSGGYIYRDGTYRWKKIEVKADAPGATIISNPTFDVGHSYFSTGTDTTTVTGVTLQGGLYVVPHGTVTFDGCTFTGQLRVPNGDGAFAVTGCTFTGATAAQDSDGYVMHYQAAGTLAFSGNTVADGYRRGLNIDNKDLTATVEKNKLGTTTDAGRSAIQISTCVKLAVTGNEIKLNGGNAFTFHEVLLGLSAAPEVSISGNTVTGTGYLVYDDAVANDKAFTSDNLKLTYATDNTVAETVDTTKGVKGSTEYALSGTVATTLHSVDFAAFVDALKAANNTFDGSKHALAQNGKLTVKWSPVSGCYDTRAGHECTVGNVAATANTPKRVNSGLTQFQLFEGESHAVNVKNVAFVYEPAAFTVCENSGWKGTFTAEQAPAGQIYLMNTGDVTFEGCTFDKVVLTSFNCTGTSTVKDCSFKNVYNSYAVKDIRGAKVAVTGCTFENCGAAVMVSSTKDSKVEKVTISGNTFKKVDVAGTTPDDKVGTRGLVQIASSGDYAGTAFDFSDNKATDCGPVLRQLNETVSFDADDKTNLGKLVSDGGASTFYTDDTFVAQVGDTKYATLAEAITDVQNGETIVVNAGEYKLNGSLTYTGKAFTIQAAEGAKVSFDMSKAVALHGAKITFSGVTFDYKTNGNYIGLQHADTLVYNDCTVNGKVFLYAASETFNRCTFVQEVEDYNVWTYGAKSVTFNDCTFNCVGKSVLVYNEGSISKTELAVSDCEFKASAPVEGKAAIEIDTSLMAGGATITVDAKTTAEGFAEGSNSKNTLWNDKKQKQDTNKNTTVTVAGETVFTPIVAQVGEKTYTTLAAALADVAEGKPLTWVAEGSWPVKTPVYYNGTFYETGTGFAAKGALERAIDAANAEGAAAVAKIYVRPGFAADELVLQAHQQLKTGLAIYGNDAKLSCNWEPCVEYPGTSGDSGAHQLTKDVSLAIYNLHNGAGFWGRRTTAYTVDLKLSGCRNAHQVMFYGNADTGVKGKTNISVTNCTFDATNKETGHNVLVTIGAGTVDVSDTTFTAANINVKNVDGGDNVITVKDCTFKDTVAGNQNIRVRSYAEGTHADLTIENVTFAGDSTQNVEIGDSKAECKGVVNYTITKTSGTMNVYKQGVTTAEATTLDAAVAYSGDNVGTIADEKALRRAFCEAPTDGTAVTVTLGADITLETLYAAENFGTEKLDDNAEGDTFNRYKVGVHPTAEDPNHWNPLVTEQTQEQRLVYGAYYHMSATDERIARLVVKAGQKIVLDLNGHTIQKNARATHGDWSEVCTDIIGNYGTLEIVDSSTGAKGTIKGIGYISCQGAVLHNYAGATMTVTGVNVDGNAAGMAEGTGQYVVSNEGGTLTIDGANVFDTATTADASLVVNTAGTVTITGNATLNHPTTKTVNVKGGVVNVESATIISDTYAIYAKSGTVNVNGLTVSGSGTLAVDGNTATITKKPGVELPAPSGFMWVENDGKQVLKSFVAKVGETAYVTIAEAFAALSAKNHTLALLNENAWDAATPVYWAAGTQSGYAATLTDTLTAAYKANEGAITIVCRPGADVGEMTHGHVADDLTIYGNDAYLSGGECDLEVDTYTFSRATGKQVTAGGVCLDGDITITAYELDNLGVWGERHTAHKVTVNLTDCDGKALEGKTNVQRVYISGTTGVNDITLTDCDFLTKATAVYSNADGAIKAVKCSFTGGQVPFNINHKANGTQTVAVENCTFTNCGDAGGWKQFAAPLRLVNSGAGTQSAEVTGCAFAGTVGANGDILLGDGRTGQASNDVELKVVNTAANIQAQKPGYYGVETVDATKKATAVSPADGTLETSVAKLLPVNDGSEAHPYSREQFAAMTRADYIAAQKRLGGTLYVNVGDYTYEKNGVLGNGVRNDTPGQVPDHSKLNAYGENGYLGEKNDGANGHAVVFVGGTITSDVTGYTSIDNIGTSLLLAVPAYTKVTFKETTFKNVLSFDYQLYTSPWSQLGGLTFNGCTFDGIIVGAIASQELAFNGCTFNDYVNTTSANSSNPTWIRPAYGNWTKGDNEGQGTDFRSLTKITFENNTVTSTRPVKFERIAQWEMATTVTATNNTFAITPQEGDKDEKKTKNVGLYFGANAKFDLVIDKNEKSGETAALYTAVYSAPNNGTYVGLPAGSTVKNAAGNDVTAEDALAWKTTDKITLKTTEEVASVTNAKGVSVNFATLADAIAAAKDGETVKLLADTNGDGIAIASNTFKTGLTVDFGGHTYTVGGLLVGSSGTASNGFQLNAGNKITFKNGAIVGATATAGAGTDWKGAPAILIQNYCDLTLEQMTVKGGDETCYTLSNNNGEIVIDGSTIVAGKGTKYGPFAFDVCRYANYPSVHVTVKGASVIDGDVEISGTIGDNQSRQLDIEGGTFKGAFTVAGNIPANIAISGGTFATAIDETYCAAGFIPTKNADGTYGVKEGAYVAQVGTTKYDTVDAAMEAAAASETATTVNLISESEDATLVPTWFIKNDVTIDADSAVTATFAPVENADDAPDTDGMAYLASFDAKSTRTVTVGENVTLSFPNTAVKKGALYFGYGSDGNWAPMNMMINGRVEAYLPYLGAQSTMTISKTGSLKALAENLITRWGSTMTVTGTDGAWTATKPQVSLGYASQQGGEVTFKDTFVKAGSWWQMWNRNGRDDYATKLTLDNTSFVADAFKGSAKDGGTTSAYEVELKNSSRMTISGDFGVIAEGSVTIEAGSLIIAKSIDNAGTFIVDATGITAPVKVFDYTGTVEMTLADYGAVNVVGGEAYVEDGDLWVRELPVAKIGETVYGSLADAVVAAQGGDTVTLLTDVALTEALTLDKDLTLDLGGKTVTAGAVKTTRLSNDGCYAGFVVNGSAQVAVKNGTLTSAYATYKDGTTSASYSSYVVLVDDTAHLTLDGVCVVGQDAGDNYVRASGGICYDSTGSLTLKSCTVSAGASNGKGYNYNNPAAIFTVSGCDGTLVVDATTVTGGAATGIKMDKDGSAAINVNGGVDVTVSNGSKLVGGGSAKTAGNALEARGSGTLKVSDSTLQGGSSTDGIGGSALYVTSSTVTAEVTGATLVGGDGGTSWDGSGVVLNKAATVTITDSTVKSGRGENATGNAAAITLPNWESADLTLSNVSLSGSDRNTVIKNGLTDGIKLAGDVTVDAGTLKNVAISELGENVSIMISEGAAAEEDTIVSLDPDRALVKDSDVLFRSGMAVAQVVDSQGNKMSYATLASAIAAAEDGETVKLLADVTESVTIPADRTLTLDLNGKTLSAGKASEALTVTGHLTIDDTSAAKSGRVVGDGRYAVYMKNRTAHVGEAAVGGSLTLNAGSLEGATYGVYILANQAAFTMNGGKVSATQAESIRVNNDYHAKTISLLSGEVGDVFLGSISSTELTTLTVGKADQTDPAAVKVGKIGLQYNRGLFRLELYNGLVGELPEIGSCTATYTALGMLVKSDANCPSGKVFEAIDYNGETWYRIAALQKIAITFDDSKTVALPFATDWLKEHVGKGEASWTTEALEEKATNGLAKWQCYLFGLDPRKEDAKVVATAGQGTDKAIPLTVANADASASPLVKGGYVTVAYVLMGSNDGTVWTQVATFDKRDGLAIPLTGTTYKFYRVDVTVTSAEGN